jgi:NAD(P)-dependent dehydrogenase (short-subunit alcohol dehydrogenase family)
MMSAARDAQVSRPRICVVTGAGAGLGEATARRLARLGDEVVAVDRVMQRAQKVADEIRESGGAATAQTVDVSDEGAVTALADWLAANHGRVDVIVNCAGVALAEGSVVEMSRKAWDLTIAVNLTGTFLVCRHLVPLMHDGGSVINVATAGARRIVPGSDAYVAAKGGVIALTKAMALSLADRGVRCNVINPGVFATDEVRSRIGSDRVEAMLARTAPIGRDHGEPDEFADAVQWLAGAGASFVNGAEIPLDGGATV